MRVQQKPDVSMSSLHGDLKRRAAVVVGQLRITLGMGQQETDDRSVTVLRGTHQTGAAVLVLTGGGGDRGRHGQTVTASS